MEVIIIFAIGVVVGCIISAVVRSVKSVGTLRLDTSDPDGPFMFLELSKGIPAIASKKYVLLKVNLKSYISRK